MAPRSYFAQPNHKPKLHHIAVNKQKLRPPALLGLRVRVPRRSRSPIAVLRARIGQQHISQAPQQEERVGAEAVQEYDPADPRAAETNPCSQVGKEERDDDVHELVAAVCDEVEELRGAFDSEDVGANPDDGDLEQDNRDSNGSS